MADIYDWRRSLCPNHQFFRAGGQAISGARTLGGFSSDSPEPGGLGELYCEFSAKGGAQELRDISWTASRIMNGAVMRMRLAMSPQLVASEYLSGPVPDGVPWSNGEPWSTGENWGWNPTAPVAATALRGSEEISVDMTAWGPVLQYGHVFGLVIDGYDYAHMVMDADYSGDIATLSISPPLRRTATTDHVVGFRPSMLVRCTNAQQVMGQFINRRIGVLNPAQFVEALL